MSGKIRLLLCAGASMVSVPTMAHAQTAAAKASTATTYPDAASDIIVTARRVEERLQDVPISITVFNQQQVSDRNMVNAGDLAIYTPSLSANGNYGPDNTSFAIRGFVQDSGTAPSVGVYFADVVALRGPSGAGTQAGDTAGPGDFFDLQNIQVLKGPQGTLQGRNTTGGAVLFVPQKPTSKLEGYVEGSYGNYGMKRIQGVLNVPFSDIARFRIAVDHENRDGWLHNISGIGPKDFNDIDYTAVRASLVVDLTPDLENYMIASYSRSSTNGSFAKQIGCNNTGANATGFTDPLFGAGVANFGGLLACGQLAREKADGAGFYDVERAFPNPISQITRWQLIDTTTWHASDTLTIKNIVSYGQFVDKQRTPLFGTNWQTGDLPALYRFVFFRGVPPIFTDINAAPDSSDQSTFTEEVQAQGSALDDKLTYQGGAYYELSQPLAASGSISNQLLACSNISAGQCTDLYGEAFGGIPVGALNFTSARTSFRDVGVYAQANYAITSTLKLTGGARYTWDREDISAVRYFENFNTGVAVKSCTNPLQSPSCREFLEQKSNKPTWLIDLDYKPTDDILAYVKYARGYRAGGVAPNAPAGFQSFGPEKVDSFEGGIKTSFRGALHGTFNVSGFYNDFSNQQLQLGFNTNPNFGGPGIPAPVSPTTAIVNAGKSRIWGIELESTITPFAGFTIDAGYTYLNATIRKIRSFGTSPTSDGLYVPSQAEIPSGTPLVLSPKNKVSVTATYTLSLDRSIGRISIGATFTRTDKMFTDYVYLDPAAVALFGGHNYDTVAATNLLNLNLNWRGIAGTPIDLSLFATNVTQKHYHTFIAGLGGLTGFGSEFASLGEPRMFGMRLRYRFGS